MRATSDAFEPAPVAKTMYCRPWCMKVIGTALVRDGISSPAISLPVALSTANSFGVSTEPPPPRPVP